MGKGGKENRFYSGPPIEGDHEFLWREEQERLKNIKSRSGPSNQLDYLNNIYGSQTKPPVNDSLQYQIMDSIKKAKTES